MKHKPKHHRHRSHDGFKWKDYYESRRRSYELTPESTSEEEWNAAHARWEQLQEERQQRRVERAKLSEFQRSDDAFAAIFTGIAVLAGSAATGVALSLLARVFG